MNETPANLNNGFMLSDLSPHDRIILEMRAHHGDSEAILMLDQLRGPANYGWIIDTDHLFIDFPDGRDDSGVVGPRRIRPEVEADLKAGMGEKFRMYDDDGTLYYSGRAIVTDATWPNDCDDEVAFAPLSGFGTPNAGCTEIRYQVRTEAGGTAWVTL